MHRRLIAFASFVTTCLAIAIEAHAQTQRVVGENPSASDRIVASLNLLAKSASTYTEERKCFSCHHQTLPVIALQEGKRRGFAFEEEAKRQVEFTHKSFSDRREQIASGGSVPGGPFTAGYALMLLGENDWKPDETTRAVIKYLEREQAEDGSWWIKPIRPPMEQSTFTSTATSLRALQLYPPPENASAEELEAFERRIRRAREWLDTSVALTNEDKTFRLLGLRWAGAPAERLKLLGSLLASEQRFDGGWAQEAGMASDAYATGQALVALHLAAGMATDDPVYARGIKFLKAEWKEDGSWFVANRCKPVQVYFESDFPHGKAQFISIAATSWSAQALLFTRPPVTKRP